MSEEIIKADCDLEIAWIEDKLNEDITFEFQFNFFYRSELMYLYEVWHV